MSSGDEHIIIIMTIIHQRAHRRDYNIYLCIIYVCIFFGAVVVQCGRFKEPPATNDKTQVRPPRWGTTSQVYTTVNQLWTPSDGREVLCMREQLPEHGNVVGSRPSDNERRVRRLGNFGHFIDHHGRIVEPNFRYSDLVLKFKVTTGFCFGHQQQIIKQKQMAFLTVHTLHNNERTLYIYNIKQPGSLVILLLFTLTNWTGVSIMNFLGLSFRILLGVDGGDSDRRDFDDRALLNAAVPVPPLFRINPFIF